MQQVEYCVIKLVPTRIISAMVTQKLLIFCNIHNLLCHVIIFFIILLNIHYIFLNFNNIY